MRQRCDYIVLVLLGGMLLFTGCSKSDQHSTAPSLQRSSAKYHCPMHPTVVSDKPGDCQICGMRLVPFERGESQATAPAQAAPKKKTMYRSTMNPNEVSDKPGKDSMGMDMVPFEIEEGSEKSTVQGLATVSITPATRERMGLTLGTVEKKALFHDVRTSARIVADETRLFRVSTKIEGWVDKLFVNVTGQEVKKGDPLLTIYSPDLVSAQQEYLIAAKTEEKLAAATSSDAFAGSQSLLAAARRRLQLWDISGEQIDRLAKTGEVEKNLTLQSPSSGWVIEKSVLPGQKVMPGDPLLVVADLTRVWGDADIYQSDLLYVKVGMPVEISIPDWEGKAFKGTVTFLSPTLSPETRTVKARLEIDNAELLLRPEMFANAHLMYPLGETLAIPEAAVMRTGDRTYAFKNAGEGRLIPVEITIGPRANGTFQLLSGLSEGDKVVTSANFLVDSESSLKAALEAMARRGETGTQPATGGHQP
jgi:Cu(I)/Ag(I) efflux system membrane fusion protein/cobalt-zinc-cadmium efflux system membrane fusion protein